ncbi:ABC transporter ATP-binding protein [Rarobacter faecitabidus]|uniref:ABC transporter ATP-binding protein n=1 Tax=Rarobacter faecitabidus TaxID=13243 RepID=UPI001FE77F43|nr:ABC transporter ATP-binding protein [Rarobacter faecitabidus]
MIVDDVHVTYLVIGSKGGAVRARKNDSRWKRLLRKGAKLSGAGKTEIHAVKGVSFTAYDGEVIGILGTNGSGKSTLLRAICGLQPVSQGRVYMKGKASLMGVGAALMKNLTGERNIMMGCLAMGMSPREVRAKFKEIVRFSEIGDAVYLPMSTYSHGMAARLRFAISTAMTPDVLVIDEALATGDAAFKQKSRRRIAEIQEAAGTIFVVSHSARTIQSMCTRAIWLDQGEIRMDGPADAVAKEYRAHMTTIRAERRRRRRERRARRLAEEARLEAEQPGT